MKLSGSDIFIECLRKEKVDTLFGYPGGVVIPLFDKLYDSLVVEPDPYSGSKVELTYDNLLKFAKAYFNLGLAYKGSGQIEQAAGSFNKAIEINPGYAKAYYNLALIYFKQAQYQLAIEYCDRARELGFANPAFLEALKPYRQ